MHDLEYESFYYSPINNSVELQEALNSDGTLNQLYKRKYLYCPECKTALLKFSKGSALKRACLSSYSISEHLETCSHRYSPAKNDETTKYYSALNSEQIQAKLDSTIYHFLRIYDDDRNTHNSITIEDNPATAVITSQDISERKRIPTRSLNTNIYDQANISYDVPILFYGTVKLRIMDYKTRKDVLLHKLCICSKRSGKPYIWLFLGMEWYDSLINENQNYYVAFIGEYKKYLGENNAYRDEIVLYYNDSVQISKSIRYISTAN